MQVTLLFEYPSLNGGERSMLAILDEVKDTELAFSAIAPAHGPLADALRQRNIPLVPWQLRDEEQQARVPIDVACERLLEAVQRAQGDLLHANSLSMGRLLGRVASQLSQPTVAHLRDIIKLSKAAIADLNNIDSLIAVSEATHNFHISQGMTAEKLRVIYNGVDCDQFQPRPRNGKLHRELQLNDDDFLIATIGQIGLRKGQDILTHAAIQLAEKLPNAHYVLIGERHSSKQESIAFEENIATRFAEAGIAHRLHRLGYRNDVPELLNDIDLLVHPAHQEPFGRVLLEAAAAGTPIIATSVGGTTEMLQHADSALLIPAGEVDALANAIVKLYHNPELRAELAEHARGDVCNRFSLEYAAAEMLAFWHSFG